MVRIQRLRFIPEPLSIDVAREDPYRIKLLRKVSSFTNGIRLLKILIINYLGN